MQLTLLLLDKAQITNDLVSRWVLLRPALRFHAISEVAGFIQRKEQL
jgi:hypothetical protein